MELDHFKAFLAVARTGSFSLAAQELFRTQPAISVRIRTLENELGHRLLERGRRSVTLTAAGEVLYRRAESIFEEIENLSAELADLSSIRAGRVSIGASDTVSLYTLPQFVKQFTQKFPGIELTLFTQTSRHVIDSIISGKIDLGIVTFPVAGEELEKRELYRDQFVVVFPPGHGLEQKEKLAPSDLRGHPIIHLKPDTYTRRWIDGKLSKYGLQSQVCLEVSTIEVIKRLVEVGLGISLLPIIALSEELDSGRLKAVKLERPALTRSMGLVHKKGKYLSQALQAFVDDLFTFAGQMK